MEIKTIMEKISFHGFSVILNHENETIGSIRTPRGIIMSGMVFDDLHETICFLQAIEKRLNDG